MAPRWLTFFVIAALAAQCGFAIASKARPRVHTRARAPSQPPHTHPAERVLATTPLAAHPDVPSSYPVRGGGGAAAGAAGHTSRRGVLVQWAGIGAALAAGTPPALAAPTDLKAVLDARGQLFAARRRLQQAGQKAQPESPMLMSSKERIRVLYAYLVEIERLIFGRRWETLGAYVGVFIQQETAFVRMIEETFPDENDASQSTKSELEYEAQQMFLALDDMTEAATLKQVDKAEKAYVALAIAYDRFLKAGDLYSIYDDIDTSRFYKDIPEDMLVFERESAPRVQDQVLVIGGPDRGRTGKLIGISEGVDKGIVRIDILRTATDTPFEVKIIDMKNLAKTLPDKPMDAQMRLLLMCPGGLLSGCKG